MQCYRIVCDNLVLVLAWVVLCCKCVCVECIFTPVLEIGQGKLRGLRSVSGQNRYYGIPYAVSERFQAPQDPPPWPGVFNAVNRLGHCAQQVSFLTLGVEQCLELDVYSPERVKPARLLPVLVFIHGGAYYYGTKGHYDPEFLVTKGVVVVIINYRVGILGFLCANDVANLGLKDQVAALKWIQRNIAAFGGDPDNVTISGQSAGASAAAMHMLSKSSQGLFHKAFLMSGTPLTPWAYNVDPLTPAFEDVSKIKLVNSEEQMFQALSNASVVDILQSCRDVSTNPKYFKYTPCIDSNFSEPFFHDTPLNIIQSGQFSKVPMIIGYADVEGMLFYGLNDEKTFEEWNDNFTERLPAVLSVQSDEKKEEVAGKIRSYYFRKKTIDKKAIKEVVNFYSDWIAYASVDSFVDLMKKYSDKPVFKYMFSYEGDRNFAKSIFGQSTGLAGASHSDDIFYVFKPGGLSFLLSNRDKLFIDRFTTLITNFMKHGDPTPSTTPLLPVRWPDARTHNSSQLRLDRRLAVTSTPPTHTGRFLHDMLCKHALPGYTACL